MKKALCMLLMACMLLFPSASSRGAEEAAPTYRILYLTESPGDTLSLTAQDFNVLSCETQAMLDLIVTTPAEVARLDRTALSRFLSGGGVLCMETADTEGALNAAYRQMGYDAAPVLTLEGAEPVGAFVKQNGDRLDPGILSVGGLSFSDSDKGERTLENSIDLSDFLSHVQNSPADTDGLARCFYSYTGFDKILGRDSGDCFLVQTVRDVCTVGQQVNSDVTAHITVDAGTNASVTSFTVRMGTDSPQSYIIDQTYIAAGPAYRNILNDFATNTCNNWTAVPQDVIPGGAWDLSPAIRVVNDTQSGRSTAYTAVQNVCLSIGFLKIDSQPLKLTAEW